MILAKKKYQIHQRNSFMYLFDTSPYLLLPCYFSWYELRWFSYLERYSYLCIKLMTNLYKSKCSNQRRLYQMPILKYFFCDKETKKGRKDSFFNREIRKTNVETCKTMAPANYHSGDMWRPESVCKFASTRLLLRRQTTSLMECHYGIIAYICSV